MEKFTAFLAPGDVEVLAVEARSMGKNLGRRVTKSEVLRQLIEGLRTGSPSVKEMKVKDFMDVVTKRWDRMIQMSSSFLSPTCGMPKTSAPKKVQHVVALPPYLSDYVEGLASHHQESVSATIKRCVEAMAEMSPKGSALEQAISTYIDQHYADGVAHGKALRPGPLGRHYRDDRGNQHMLDALYTSVKLPIVGSFDEISTTLDLALKSALSMHVADLESLGATHFLNGRAFRAWYNDGHGTVMFVTYYIAAGDQTA